MADKYIREEEVVDEPRNKETVVVRDENPRSSNTGWIILAVVLIVILALIFLGKGALDNNGGDIKVDAPKVDAPSEDTTNIQLPEPNPNPPTNSPTENQTPESQ